VGNYQDADATSKFVDRINETGWSFLTVEGHISQRRNDRRMAFAAGWSEGISTVDRLSQYAINSGFMDAQSGYFDSGVIKFMHETFAWVNSQVTMHRESDPFWNLAGLVQDQLDGLLAGYNSARESRIAQGDTSLVALNNTAFLMLNWDNDASDVSGVVSSRRAKNNISKRFHNDPNHCSVIVRRTEDGKDLVVAHTTWTSYPFMLRTFKKYILPYAEARGGSTIEFSSFPGVILSGDDWYTTKPANLVVTETTIDANYDEVGHFIQPNTVPYLHRHLVANRLAVDAISWSRIMSYLNSGTYNNQWMIVDMKKFDPNEPNKAPEGLFVVAEQMPGHWVSKDMSRQLYRTDSKEFNEGYWSSFNIPFFPEIYDISEDAVMYRKDRNPFWLLNETARSLIFQRDAPHVQTFEDVKRLIRYNNYKNDPLSRCAGCSPPYSADLAIAARDDLTPVDGHYPLSDLENGPSGGIDAKVTSYSRGLKSTIISGPTADQVPPFVWSTSIYDKDLPHVGMPDKWDFSWMDAEFDSA